MARIKTLPAPTPPSPAPAAPAKTAKAAPCLCPKCKLAYSIKASPEGYCQGCESRLIKTIGILQSYGYDISR